MRLNLIVRRLATEGHPRVFIRGGCVEELLNAVASLWRTEGVEPHGGATPETIRAFEQRYNVQLPEEVRAYFAHLNGMPERGCDSEFVQFWPLERVRSVADELRHQEPVPPSAEQYFCFADYSVWCNAYAVRLSADGAGPADVVAVYSGTDLIPAASSFSEFLRQYISPGRRSVLHPEFTKDGKRYGVAP